MDCRQHGSNRNEIFPNSNGKSASVYRWRLYGDCDGCFSLSRGALGNCSGPEVRMWEVTFREILVTFTSSTMAVWTVAGTFPRRDAIT